MKELSIEEKAKRYDEALKYAMIYYKNGNEDMKMMMKTCFPVLAEESEDERIRKEIIEYMKNKSTIPVNKCNRWTTWLEKQGEKKPAWGEEDEKMLDSIIEEVRYMGDFPDYPTEEEDELYDECLAKVKWLKSIKDRVQPQQEWSEEDKYNLSDIEAIIHTIKGDGLNADKLINWVKSLKDRVQPQPNR